MCGLLPFLAVSILHLLYASRCWSTYTRNGVWAGMLALNVLILVPYANVLALPALLAWLVVAWCRCGGGGKRVASAPAPAPVSSPGGSGSGSVSLSLSRSAGADGGAPSSMESESISAASLDLHSASSILMSVEAST